MSERAKRYLRHLMVIALSAAMVLTAELLHETEIIFPEIVALLLGAWIAVKQPWKVNKPMLILLMTASSVAGVCIVRYLPLHTFLQAAIGFLFLGTLLCLSRTTLVPALSACILPVLLHTTTWIYPISVLILCTVIVCVKKWLEQLHWIEPPAVAFCPPPRREDWIHWGKLFAFFLIASAAPIFTHQYYFIAPPLLVTFVEFSEEHSPVRKIPGKVLLAIVMASLIGFGARWLLRETLHWPLAVAALVAVVLMLALLEGLGIGFPPVGAVCFLPFILPMQTLWLYPVEITIGSLVFIAAALLLFRPKRGKQISVS